MSSGKKTPEYEALRSNLHDICSSLSSRHSTITPLANDLCGTKLIAEATKDAVTSLRSTPPYELASQLMSSVQISVQYDIKKFYVLAQKLHLHGNTEVAIKLLEECERRGGRKKDETLQLVNEDAPIDLSSHEVLKQEPNLRLFVKFVANRLEDKWREVGILLGVPHNDLEKLKKEFKDDQSRCFWEIFEMWRRHCKVPFTWESLLKELDSHGETRIVTMIKKDIIRELENNETVYKNLV